MEKLLKDIESNLSLFKVEASKQCESGNKSAGLRARKLALELVSQMKEFRKISVSYGQEN